MEQLNPVSDSRIKELRTLIDHGVEAGIGVGHSLGITLAELAPGRAVFTLVPSTDLANALYIVHGGVLSTLMDTALGSAIFSQLPDHTSYSTLELNVHFTRSVKLDAGMIRCEAEAVHVGRRTATAQARITDETGRLVAHGSCSCLVIAL